MFHKQYIVFVLLALVALTASQVSRMYGNKKHPTLEDHCYDTEHKIAVKVNEWVSPTGIDYQCFKMFCRDDFVLQVDYCARGTPSCGNKPDYSKPYPECCSDC